jgi:hypothetical protein
LTTEYHAKLFAHELTRQRSVADAEKLAGTLLDAQVDLNPHQVVAALFAFKSPLSKGAILADEVGLGKTIEAGLVLAHGRKASAVSSSSRRPTSASNGHRSLLKNSSSPSRFLRPATTTS